MNDAQRKNVENYIAEGNINGLEGLLKEGVDLNEMVIPRMGFTAAHIAAYSNQSTILEWLHKNGVDMNAPNKDGDTPLQVAANEANWNTVDQLIDMEPNPNHANKNGETVFHSLAADGKVELLKKLVDAGYVISNQCDKDGKNVCDWALRGNKQTENYLNSLGLRGTHNVHSPSGQNLNSNFPSQTPQQVRDDAENQKIQEYRNMPSFNQVSDMARRALGSVGHNDQSPSGQNLNSDAPSKTSQPVKKHPENQKIQKHGNISPSNQLLERARQALSSLDLNKGKTQSVDSDQKNTPSGEKPQNKPKF